MNIIINWYAYGALSVHISLILNVIWSTLERTYNKNTFFVKKTKIQYTEKIIKLFRIHQSVERNT